MNNTALLLIDIQNDYFPGGKMELQGSDQVVLMAKYLLDFFRELQHPIYHIQQISIQRGSTFFLPQTSGTGIHTTVTPLASETVIQKHYPNSFRETNLLSCLYENDIHKLIIAGMMTHMCVDATVRAAADYGFECWIALDACTACDLKMNDRVVSAEDVHMAFLASLHGTYGKVMNTEKIIQRLRVH